MKYAQQTVLVPKTYIRLAVPQPFSFGFDNGASFSTQPTFYVDGNIHYPNAILLLQSFVKVILEETCFAPKGGWLDTLAVWSGSYLYSELSLRDDILDNCKDKEVKEYFERQIRAKPGASRVRGEME